jgi:hypothetical protein
LPALWVVESRYLTTLASGTSAFSTSGSFIVPSHVSCSSAGSSVPFVLPAFSCRALDNRIVSRATLSNTPVCCKIVQDSADL